MIKVFRTEPAPESLKDKGERWEKDLLIRLQRDFHDKCYICGKRLDADGEVEHLQPVLGKKHPERKHQWSNLFWSCGHCNGIKSTRANILNCCSLDPETYIRQKGDGTGEEGFQVEVEALNPDHPQAAATAKLIEDCYSSTTTPMRELICEKKREKLKECIDTIDGVLLDYVEMRDNNEDLTVQREILRGMVRLDREYAGFVRTEVRDYLDCCPELASILAIENEDAHTENEEHNRTEVSV